MDLVSPSRTITIGATNYVLDGSFGTLRAIQQSFSEDILNLLVRTMDLRLDEVAKLIALASSSTEDEVGQAILDDLGLTTGYVVLKSELYAWLAVAIAPKQNREKKRTQAEEVVTKARALSPGPTTNASPSEPSAGSPPNSGEATSGN